MSSPMPTPWLKLVLGLAHVVQTRQLPPPICVSWNPYDGQLVVQVEEPQFRPWLEAVHAPVLEAVPHEGAMHLYATGELSGCRMVSVRVVAVSHQVGQLQGAP